MLVSQQGWLLPSAPESSALSLFSLALESSQGFFSGAVSSLINWDVLSGTDLSRKRDWHDIAAWWGMAAPLLLKPRCGSGCLGGSGGWVVLSRERFHSDACVPLQRPMSSQTSCLLLFFLHIRTSWWKMVLMHPLKLCYLIADQDSAMQTRTRHLTQEHWRSPYEKSAVTSCVNKTSLSNLCNINPKIMNKSAFLALVCRDTEDYKMRCWQG